jgi:hypothetical protein
MKNPDKIRVPVNRNVYSAEAQRRTLDGLDLLYAHLFMLDNSCHLKNRSFAQDGTFGYITLQDALASRLLVREKDGHRTWEYLSVQDLVNDGWVID